MNTFSSWTSLERRIVIGLGAGQSLMPSEDGGARMGKTRVSPDVLRRLLSVGAVSAGNGGFVLTEAGQCLRRRMTAQDDGFRAQHHIRQTARRDIDGAPRDIVINLAESPLGRIAARAGAAGAPLLSKEQIIAGERLRIDYECAALGAGVTMRYDGIAGRTPGNGELNPSERQIAARTRLRKALDAAGPHLADVLLRICCLSEGLEQAERTLKWPRRSAKLVLAIALDRLAAHYDELSYGVKGAARPKGAGGTPFRSRTP